MRELEVLSDGHLNLRWRNWKEFFEEELGEQVRSQVKQLLEQALEAERDRYLDLGYYEHDPEFRLDYRNGYYFRDFATRLGLLRRLRMPRYARAIELKTVQHPPRRAHDRSCPLRFSFTRNTSRREELCAIAATLTAMNLSSSCAGLSCCVLPVCCIRPARFSSFSPRTSNLEAPEQLQSLPDRFCPVEEINPESPCPHPSRHCFKSQHSFNVLF